MTTHPFDTTSPSPYTTSANTPMHNGPDGSWHFGSLRKDCTFCNPRRCDCGGSCRCHFDSRVATTLAIFQKQSEETPDPYQDFRQAWKDLFDALCEEGLRLLKKATP